MNRHSRILSDSGRAALSVAVSGLMLAMPATAQGDNASAPSPSGPRTQIETVVTQSQKTEGDVQTTPISLTTVEGDALQRTFAQDFRDLMGAAPNVILQPVGSFQNASAFFIRGAGSVDIESAADPGIAVLIDGIYMARTSTALVDFLDVEAVEVLRGPQGTLFGRNAIGGAVMLRHRAPNVEEFEIGGSVLAGNYGRIDIKGVVNVPLVEDKLALRLAMKSTNFDGYYYNTFDNTNLGGADRLTILPSLRFESDNFDITLRGEIHRARDDSGAQIPYNACRVDPHDADIPPGSNDVVVNLATIYGDADEAASYCSQPISKEGFNVAHEYASGRGAHFDIWGLTGEINYTLPDIGTVTYVGNYRDVEEDIFADFDTTGYNLFEAHRQQWHWQTSHELRFASDFSDFVDFVAGFYYFEQHYVLEQDTLGALLNGTTEPGVGLFGRSEQSHRQWSLFGQANWHVTDRLTLVTGVRYDDEQKDFFHCGVGFGDAATRTCFPNIPGVRMPGDLTFDSSEDIGDPNLGFAPGTNKWSSFSPKVSVNYQFTDDIFGFASWSRGFRSGGFNGRANTPATAGPFDDEKVDNYEVGVKSEFFDRRLRVNLSLFWAEYSDLQRSIIRPAPGGQETVTENAADARSRGVELEVTAIPFEGFTINGSLGYLDADTLAWCADLNGPLTPTPADKEPCGTITPLPAGGEIRPFDNAGLEILNAPQWQTRLNIVYEVPVANTGFLTFSGEWRYMSSASLVAAGFPPGTTNGVLNYNGVLVSARRPRSHIFNANVTWADIEDRYRVSFFVKNITNELYTNTATYVAGLVNFTQYNEPRHWGVEISFDL